MSEISRPPSSIACADTRFFAGSSDTLSREEIHDRLLHDGLVFVRYTGGLEQSGWADWFSSLFAVIRHRDSDETGVTRIRPRRNVEVLVSQMGFTNEELALHVDGAGMNPPPPIMASLMAQPSTRGGGSLLVDGAALVRDLAASELASLSTAGSYSWGPESGQLPLVEEAEGRTIMRYREDYAVLPVSREAASALEAFREACRKHLLRVRLEAGDMLILHNQRWLHGRERFDGARELWRLLGQVSLDPYRPLNDGFSLQ